MKTKFRILVVSTLMVSLVVMGCATTGENTSGRTLGTAIGAIAGAFIGGKNHGAKGALVGAIAGGLAGYAVGWMIDEYQAKKTKTAQQVREQYAVQSQDTTPQPVETKAYAYATTVSPSETVLRGESAEVVTSFDLMAPEGAPVKVEEERTILKPDGSELAKKRYHYKEVDGAGGYEFRTKVEVPKEIDQGYFAIASKLYVDGNEAGATNSSFQVVRGDTDVLLVAGLQ